MPHALWVRGPLDPGRHPVRWRSSGAGGHDLRRARGDRARVGARRRSGWTVVSGAATASTAPRTGLPWRSAGPRWPCWPDGVDDAYPRGHRALLDRVAEPGLVVSELPLLSTRPGRVPRAQPPHRRAEPRHRRGRDGAAQRCRPPLTVRTTSARSMAVPGPVTSATERGLPPVGRRTGGPTWSATRGTSSAGGADR